MSGGFSSRLYVLEDISSSTSNETKTFLIRLYGGKLVNEDDPFKTDSCEVNETLVFYAISLAGLGPRLYGSFDGGRVEEFVPSHVLREKDYEQRPETVLELARKLARFHALNLPISKERNRILEACEHQLQNRDLEKFRKVADHVGMTDISAYEHFDVQSEISWLKKLESSVGGRIVTTLGDINKNNILVLDKPDKFGERVMIIDYEGFSMDFRGRDIGQIFLMKIVENNDGYLCRSCDYPDEAWRRKFIAEYLKETESMNNFLWNENLDNVEHLVMETEFFVFHSIHVIIGFLLNQGDDSFFYKMETDQAMSFLTMGLYFIEVYQQRKTIFVQTYGKQLNLSE
ncbi:choline/ethanolamine kinase-like [Bradysia coprophila]|uniref:choline/ethanolamine kinase-like n=1 Tax=Bradysia coprophila TaxID=38358 RepID=UPI00187D8B7F|nr:choline/ethanolamine kinase-like [Bradysia coprophila]